MVSEAQIREAVRDHYASAALSVMMNAGGGCGSGGCACGSGGCGGHGSAVEESHAAEGCACGSDGCGGHGAAEGCGGSSAIEGGGLYFSSQTSLVPEGAVRAALGCGNPIAMMNLRPGETVLDLGSGGGIDALLAALHVGESGKVIGIDLTEEMVSLAQQHAEEAGIDNVEFLGADIEAIPLPSNSVDVVISNCAINLAPNKDKVFSEIARVLKPGGRFGAADMVIQGHGFTEDVIELLDLWTGCVTGALTEQQYHNHLSAAGLSGVEIDVLNAFGSVPDPADDEDGMQTIVSAFISATKPA